MKTVKLTDVCEVFADGDWIESKDQSKSGIRLVQTGNIGAGKFKDKSDRARYVSEDTFTKLRCTEIFPGDLLVSRLPEPVGRACIIPQTNERMITAVDCTIIRPKSDVILSEYLLLFMMTPEYFKNVESACTGTTRKRISRKNLGKINLTVPSLEEQRRVVAKLDAAFEQISAAEVLMRRNLDNVAALQKSILHKYLSADDSTHTHRLGDVIRIRSGDFLPRKKMVTDGEYIVVGGNGVSGQHNQYNRTGENIVIGRVGEKCGNVHYYNESVWVTDNAFFVSEYLMPVDKQYLTYILRNIDLRQLAKQSAQPVISFTGIKNATLYVPEVDVQRNVVEKLNAALSKSRELESQYTKKLTKLTDLRQSLLQEAFNTTK